MKKPSGRVCKYQSIVKQNLETDSSAQIVWIAAAWAGQDYTLASSPLAYRTQTRIGAMRCWESSVRNF